MPDGVVLLNIENEVIWANDCFKRWSGQDAIINANFYQALGSPEILGPDFCPFHTALATGRPSGSTLRTSDNRYFQVHAAPVTEHDGRPRNLIVTVRDVTTEVLQQQKLAAIHDDGRACDVGRLV